MNQNKKTSKKSKNKTEPSVDSKTETKAKQTAGLKNLGQNLQAKFSARGDRAWRPTKPGGRNGQGKPT